MSVGTAQTIDLRGAQIDLLLFEGSRLPIRYEIAADLTGASVRYEIFGLPASLVLTETTGAVVEPGQGHDEQGNQIAKPGFSLVSLRKFTTGEWNAFVIAPGGVSYELYYEMPGSPGDEDTPYYGKWEITRRKA